MVRHGAWIKGRGCLFHAGSATTGYPAVKVEAEGNRLCAVVMLPGNQGALRFPPQEPADAIALADQIVALILEAHASGSAK